MRSSKGKVLGAVLLGAMSIAAGRQLAMRVELAPVGAGETGILTEIRCVLAPEDRGALGSDAMLWVELTRAEQRVLRRGWALTIDDPAVPLAITAELPEGEFQLRVDVIGAGDRARGVWFGDVSINPPVAVPAPASAPASERTASAPAPASASAPVNSEARAVDPDPVPDPDPEFASAPASERTASAPAAAASAADEHQRPATSDPTPASGELTVSLVRNGLPVDDPQARDLTVTAGRTAIPVMSVVQPGDAPLVLGIALDLGPESARDQSWIGRMVGSLADRGAARVRVLHRAGVDSGWGTAPAAVTDVLATLEPSNLGDLGKLVGAALDGFSGQGGRCWLLLVTDGRRAPDGGWKGVEQRAEAAGVPILVVGLWHGEFGSANRKHLRRLVTAAGGAVFYLQGPSQIEDLIERFGAVLDGSSVVRVAAPGGTGDVEVRFIAGDASVVSSTSVRTAPASSAR